MRISEVLKAEIAAPKRELEANLAEVEATLQFFSAAMVLRPRLGAVLSWPERPGYEHTLAQEFMDKREASVSAFLLGSCVICYGSLEEFMRHLVERAVRALNSGCSDLSDIPESVLRENIFRTGQVLQTVKGGGVRKDYDYTELARALGSCSAGTVDFSLNEVCFSFSQGVMSAPNIESLLQRLSVRVDWDRFGENADIRKICGERKTRDCSVAVQRSVSALVNTRNVVAHTGGLDMEVRQEDIETYIKLLPPFCSVLIAEVGRQLDAACS